MKSSIVYVHVNIRGPTYWLHEIVSELIPRKVTLCKILRTNLKKIVGWNKTQRSENHITITELQGTRSLL